MNKYAATAIVMAGLISIGVAQTTLQKTAPVTTNACEMTNDYLRERNVSLLEENIALIKLVVEMGEMNKSMRTRLETAETTLEKGKRK